MQRATCEVQPATWTFGCQARSAEREVAEERRKRTWEALAAQQQLVQAVAERDRLQNLSDTACATLNQVAFRASIYSSAVGHPHSALLGLCYAQRRAGRQHWSWTAVRACVGRVCACACEAARTCEGDDALRVKAEGPCATRSRLAAVCFRGMLAARTLVSGGRFVQLLVKIEEEQGKAAHADELRARELAHLRLESEVRASVLVPLPPHVHTRGRTAAPNRAPQIARTLTRAHTDSRGGAPEDRRQRGPTGRRAASGRCGQTGGA